MLELEFKSNNSIKSKCLKWVVKKILPTLGKMVCKIYYQESQGKPFKAYIKKKNTYCLRYNTRRDNKLITTTKVLNNLIAQNSMCVDCDSKNQVL